ncbi:RDD family protein [Flavimaricola marinus]|uniref:RDD family protein n=1 Tax=Flavimaricola marinus TaxID=1819565 RepID=A0A238LJ87_9RHOB|nr:RDD family protein [Flavimaricola marinus]SMY09678.1 RDD family protein [Flavimaricola marinus]
MTTSRLLHGLPSPDEGAAFYAGVPLKRALAWVFDVVLIGLISAIAVPFTAFTAIFYFPFLMLVLGFLYRWFTLAGGSATWGMRLMAIEIRQADGDRLSNQSAFLHTLGYSISVAVAPLQLISVIMMLVTARGQGLTDTVMQTAAINRPA